MVSKFHCLQIYQFHTSPTSDVAKVQNSQSLLGPRLKVTVSPASGSAPVNKNPSGVAAGTSSFSSVTITVPSDGETENKIKMLNWQRWLNFVDFSVNSVCNVLDVLCELL